MDSFDKSHRSDHVQRDYRSNRGADQAARFDDPRADRVQRCHAERPGACIPGRCLPMLRKAVSGSGEHRAGPGGQGGFSRPIAAHRETRHRLLDLRAQSTKELPVVNHTQAAHPLAHSIHQEPQTHRESSGSLTPRQHEVLQAVADECIRRDVLLGVYEPPLLNGRDVIWTLRGLVLRGLVHLQPIGPLRLTTRGRRTLDSCR